MVYTAEEDERRIREKYGDMLKGVEEKGRKYEFNANRFSFHHYVNIIWGIGVYLLSLWFFIASFPDSSNFLWMSMVVVLVIYLKRWCVYYSVEQRIRYTLVVMFFIHAWLGFALFFEAGHIDNALFGWFLTYGYCLFGIPLLAYWVWRKKQDDRLMLLAYLSGLWFILLCCLVPAPDRFLIFFCAIVAYLIMCLIDYRVQEGTYTRSQFTFALDSHFLIVLILMPLFFFTKQKILLRQLPDFMSLYLVIVGLGAIEYLFYGLEKCGAFRAYDWAELEEKRRKG